MFIGSFYEKFTIKKRKPSSGAYKVDDINGYGDETSNNQNMISVSKGLYMPKPTKEALALLKNFQDWCKKRDIKLYLTFPNMAYFDEYELPEINRDIDLFIETLSQQGLSVMGRPQDAMVDKKLMFDTNYHLIKEGIKIRTKNLIALMKKTIPISPSQSFDER